MKLHLKNVQEHKNRVKNAINTSLFGFFSVNIKFGCKKIKTVLLTESSFGRDVHFTKNYSI
jgi:hypothetical protein